MVVSKDNKLKLVEPFNFKQVTAVIVAHNHSGFAALQLSETAQVMHGISHLLIESQSLGLLLRFVVNNYTTIKLDFADSISLSENGCLEELYF